MQPTAPAGSGLKNKDMATINQIKKQIETATKRIELFNGKIAMYETRANNAIAKAIKATGIANINAENYHEILNTRENWDWDYKIGSNFNYKAENEKNLAREVRNLESLNAELAKLEQVANEKETANAKVKANNPEVTEKGFEVVLTDGTNRIVYARVIWAAEYSDIVTPHTRYIVTERR